MNGPERPDAAGIAAANNDAELGARLRKRGRVDVGLLGLLLEIADPLRAVGERVEEEALRPLPAFRSPDLAGVLAGFLACLLARFGGEVVTRVDNGGAGNARGLGDGGERGVGVGLKRSDSRPQLSRR